MLRLFWMFFSLFVFAQDEEERPWSYQAELSVISTHGNAETFSFGLGNNFTYKHNGYDLQVKFGALDVENTKYSRQAEGTPDSFIIIEDKDTENTDQKYYFNGKFNKKFSAKFKGFAAIDWDRNEPSGIKNRYAGSLGVSNQWRDKKALKYKTSYGIQFTDESLVVEGPNFDGSYFGLRLESNLIKQFKNAKLVHDLILVQNLEESDDLRANSKFAINAQVVEKMAIKFGFNLDYDRQPAFKNIPLFTDGTANGNVLFELDEVDYLITTAIVVNF